MSDTPETPLTDAALGEMKQWKLPFLSETAAGLTLESPIVDLCRRLECKVIGLQNKWECAVELAAQESVVRDSHEKTLITIHRWIERNHPDGFIDSLSYAQNLERVADRWHDRLENLDRERQEDAK